MAVLAADSVVNLVCDGAVKIMIPSTAVADTFYKGAIVWSDTSGGTGLAQVGSLAAGDRILGICAEQVVIASATSTLIPVYVSGVFQFPAMTNVTGADIGDWVIMDVSAAITDNAADCISSGDATLAANDAILGRLVSYLDSLPVVQIGGMTGAIYDAAGAVSWI